MNTSGASILIVDDEIEILRALSRSLTVSGYKILIARNGEDAINITFQHHPDIVLLDLMLPGMSGMEVCRTIREQSNVPILVLSAKGEQRDKVQALDLGADDYIQKPFGMDEVQARVRVALRHKARTLRGAEPLIEIGPLQVDVARRKIQVEGREIKLTPTEYELFAALLDHRGKILTRKTLTSLIWGGEEQSKIHKLHVYAAMLRQKIEPDPLHPRFILTVPGVGYRFPDESEG